MTKNPIPFVVHLNVFLSGKKIQDKKFEAAPIVFGRQAECEIILDYSFISRHHCQITFENGNFFLLDMNSRNGFDINGARQSKVEIKGNIKFQIDEITVEVSIKEKMKVITDPKELAEKILKPKGIVATVKPNVQLDGDNTIPPDVANKPIGLQVKPGGTPKSATTSQPPVKAAVASKPIVAPGPTTAKPLEAGHRIGVNEDTIIDKPRAAGLVHDMMVLHPDLNAAKIKKLEAIVIWHDQVFDVLEFQNTERVRIGGSKYADLNIPFIKGGWSLAKVNMDSSDCYVPQGVKFSLSRGGVEFSSDKLIADRQAVPKKQGYGLKLNYFDVLKVNVGSGMQICLRYIPSTKRLTERKIAEPDLGLKQSLWGSLFLHLLIGLFFISIAPETANIPKLKNVPERFARLLVEPPKPIIPLATPIPTPTPALTIAATPTPVKIEEVKPEKAIVKVKEKQIIKTPKQIAKTNKWPITVKKPVAKAQAAPIDNPKPVVQEKVEPVPVKVESLGALAALGGASESNVPEKDMSNLNITKNAGGAPSKTLNTTGVMNTLSAQGGKLVAGGSGTLRTKGGGVGAGAEYGTQGLKGSAGQRSVEASVVGQPKLVSGSKLEGLSREQVLKVVQKNSSEIQHCYEKSLLSQPELSGRMEFEWDISPAGQVSNVKVKKSSVSNGDALGECVKGVFRSMIFPKASNGQSTSPTIGFPFGRL